MYDREPLGTWVKGRVALLGDAAHPMVQYLAQGACQALEDAAALADRLSKEDVEPALVAYQDVRATRAARVQRTARTWGQIWHVDGVAKLLRDEVFRQRGERDHTHVEWLYGT
jgi:salicylate hydroxylase